MVGNEVANGGAGTFQFPFRSQVNDQQVQLPLLWRCVCAEPLVPVYVVLEGVFDVLASPRLGLGFVNAVAQIDGEVSETGLVECVSEGQLDERAGLVVVHLAPNRYEERMTSRGSNACAV